MNHLPLQHWERLVKIDRDWYFREVFPNETFDDRPQIEAVVGFVRNTDSSFLQISVHMIDIIVFIVGLVIAIHCYLINEAYIDYR